eukprot:48730-Pyramimonas_sp.AAC.1
MWAEYSDQANERKSIEGPQSSPPPQVPKPPKKVQPQHVVALSKAKKFIVGMQMSTAAAQTLLREIEDETEGKSWAWANCEQVGGEIKKWLKKVVKA